MELSTISRSVSFASVEETVIVQSQDAAAVITKTKRSRSVVVTDTNVEEATPRRTRSSSSLASPVAGVDAKKPTAPLPKRGPKVADDGDSAPPPPVGAKRRSRSSVETQEDDEKKKSAAAIKRSPSKTRQKKEEEEEDDGGTAEEKIETPAKTKRSRSSAGSAPLAEGSGPKRSRSSTEEADPSSPSNNNKTPRSNGKKKPVTPSSKVDDQDDDDDDEADLLKRCPTRMGLTPATPTTPKERTVIPKSPVPRRQLEEGKEGFKAMVWNVCGLRAMLKNGAAAFKSLFAEEQPDVLGFNEHKLQDDHVAKAAKDICALLPGYDVHFTCSQTKKGYSGVGVVVRSEGKNKPLSIKAGMGVNSHDDEGRTITVEYEKFYVVFVYVPNSGEPIKLPRLPYRTQNWDPDLRAYLAKLRETKPVILMGDLNVAHLDADFYNPHEKRMLKTACTTPEERGNFTTLLAEGYIDTWRNQHPDATGCYSQWSVRAGNRPFNRGNRFDYAVASKELCDPSAYPHVLDSFIRDDFGVGLSDHAPIGVTLVMS